MKNILLNRTFLLIIVGILVFLNIFSFVYNKMHATVECPIYIFYSNGIESEATKRAEDLYNIAQRYTDIEGEKSFLLLTPDSPRYEQLVEAYNLTRKTNAFIAVNENGKVLSYKFPIPSETEIKKIMKALSYK